MQPAESGFQLLMMVRGELFRLIHDGRRPMERSRNQPPDRIEKWQGDKREEHEGDE